MPKVICTLRHASALINGVRFDEHELGRISEEVTEAQATALLSIPGYVREDGKPVAKPPVDNTNTPVASGIDKPDNFLPSSFADRQAAMPAALLNASPGWEANDQPQAAEKPADDASDAASAKAAAKKKAGA